MRKHVFILLMVLFAAVPAVRGELIWDTGHREYSEGNEKWVYMYNDASVDITGGYIGELFLYDDTTAKVTGGEVQQLLVEGDSFAELHEDSVVGMLRPNDNGTVTVYGGVFTELFALGNSTTAIYGGTFTILSINDSPVIKMYVQEYTWDPQGGVSNNFGLLTGIWYESGESFEIDYVDFDAIDQIVFIPEPSIILLLGAGSLFLRYKK